MNEEYETDAMGEFLSKLLLQIVIAIAIVTPQTIARYVAVSTCCYWDAVFSFHLISIGVVFPRLGDFLSNFFMSSRTEVLFICNAIALMYLIR